MAHVVLAVLFAVRSEAAPVEPAGVSCGLHRASECPLCPGGKGAAFCNGECVWRERRQTCELRRAGVSCGRHRAANCQLCPSGHGASYCHGECVWRERRQSCEPRSSRLCVVGNGPLSEADRLEIAKCSTVARFNDMKNIESGERVDIHVMREWQDTHVYSGRSRHHSSASSVLVGMHALEDSGRSVRGASSIQLPGRHRYHTFPACATTLVDKSEIDRHPTTGTIYLSELQSDETIKRVDVFGMNWNITSGHHSTREGALVDACCTKCVVHKTPRDAYSPGRPSFSRSEEFDRFMVAPPLWLKLVRGTSSR